MSGVFTGDATFGTGKTIGRYFGLVSAVPSLVLAGWLYLLWASGAWTGPPSMSTLHRNVTLNQTTSWLAVLGFALAAALVLHPLQFTIVQALEGYWGTTLLGRAARTRRTVAHLRRFKRGLDEAERTGATAEEWVHDEVDVGGRVLAGASPEGTEIVRILVDRSAAAELVGQYPNDPTHVMATRLGNSLRRTEMRAGASYRLPILSFATHLGMVANPAHTAYVQDQRNQLDLSARMSATALIATAITCLAMWSQGTWLLTALIPFTAAWLSYRGAITSANSYGQALGAWADLNRFRLYDTLRLPPPPDTKAEQTQNSNLGRMVLGLPVYYSIYQHPGSSCGPEEEVVKPPEEQLRSELGSAT